jgi:hypothetical protein
MADPAFCLVRITEHGLKQQCSQCKARIHGFPI